MPVCVPRRVTAGARGHEVGEQRGAAMSTTITMCMACAAASALLQSKRRSAKTWLTDDAGKPLSR